MEPGTFAFQDNTQFPGAKYIQIILKRRLKAERDYQLKAD